MRTTESSKGAVPTADQFDKPMPFRSRWRYNHPINRLRRLWRDPYGGVMHLVGDHTVGGNSVPTQWRHGRLPSDGSSSVLVMVSNDAGELTLRRMFPNPGTYDEEANLYSVNRREARQLAWWIIRWFAADWFGVRRRIYFWALTRHLNRTR